MGGMSAAIPIKNNPASNQKAMARVEQDKVREAIAGHDGTWVAHPALVKVAKDVFNRHMSTPNQIDSQNCTFRSKVVVTLLQTDRSNRNKRMQ